MAGIRTGMAGFSSLGGAEWLILDGVMRVRRRKPKRRGYVRPSRARTKVGWSLRELASLAGTSARAVRLYLQRELLPRPPFKGSATRYERRHLVRLLVIRRLRATERLALAEIRTRLRTLSDAELESLAARDLSPGPLAVALGVSTAPARSAAPESLEPSVSHPPRRGDGPFGPGARWTRLELALGLELHLCDDANERVRELAGRLREVALSAFESQASVGEYGGLRSSTAFGPSTA